MILAALAFLAGVALGIVIGAYRTAPVGEETAEGFVEMKPRVP